MKLPEFKSFDEKKNYYQFGNLVMDSVLDFDNIVSFLVEYSTKNKPVYRGVNEARYKLYNSGQRKFIQNDLERNFSTYKQFIQSEINSYIKENNNWENELINAGINNDNYLALLSSMQHLGYPSPCIDFTTNPLVALYFAFKDCNKAEAGTRELDNYVSLYFLSIEHNPLFFHNFGNAYRKGLHLRNVYKGENHDLSLNNYKGFECMFLSEDPMIYDITLDPDYATINNKNILNQQGLLLLNPNGTTSLEDTSQYLLRNYHGEPRLPIACINLNKSLKEHVDKFLELNGINEYMIDPIKFDKVSTTTNNQDFPKH